LAPTGQTIEHCMISRLIHGFSSPIYRRELARWSGLPRWRRPDRLGLLIALLAFGGATCLLGAPVALLPPAYLRPLYEWSSLALAALVVLRAAICGLEQPRP